MSNIILNEKEFAEECLRSGIGENKPFSTLLILAKYYYHTIGFRKKKIAGLLLEYLKKFYQEYEYNKDMWESNIQKIANGAGKYPLYEISGISVTSEEMNTIDSIDSKLLRRLAFTMLCLAKLGDAKNENNNGWVNMDSKEIFKLARITCGVDDRDIKLGMLYQKGLLEFAKRNDNMSCRVTFIQNHSDEVLFISDFRELGYEYLAYHGEKLIRCRECGILIRNNKNGTRIYCDNCKAPSPMQFKTIICVDCGTEVRIAPKNNETKRCPYCYSIYRQSKKNESRRKNKELSMLETAQKKDEEK